MLSLILHTVTELKEKINYAPTLSNYNSQIVLDNTNTNLLPKYPIKKVEKFEELDKKLKESDKFKAVFVSFPLFKILNTNTQSDFNVLKIISYFQQYTYVL